MKALTYEGYNFRMILFAWAGVLCLIVKTDYWLTLSVRSYHVFWYVSESLGENWVSCAWSGVRTIGAPGRRRKYGRSVSPCGVNTEAYCKKKNKTGMARIWIWLSEALDWAGHNNEYRTYRHYQYLVMTPLLKCSDEEITVNITSIANLESLTIKYWQMLLKYQNSKIKMKYS